VADRLYYTDPYLTEFDARVLTAGELAGRPFATLDRTAFYPSSGGQPFDTGTLADSAVVEVLEREDDEAILHVTDRRLEPGAVVRGRIDWARRFDHMQQHSGQHMLSAAFDHLFKARTVSFHLGSLASTIDLDRELPPTSIAAAEDDANRVVWMDRPVVVRFVTPEEAAAMPLRKEPQRSGPLRLIEIEGYDLSACGGTHVARTGAVGVIAVTSWERFRGGSRIEFLCGGRALASHRRLRETVAGSVRALSVLPEELPAAIERSQAENKQLRKTIKDLSEQLAVHEAGALTARGTRVGDVTLVAEALDGWDASGLKALATAVAERPGHVVALFTAASPALAVIARAGDTQVDAAAVLKALVGRFGGKGGGRADLAQGGGLAGSSADLLAAVRELVGRH
jgi:alanyl-tRNA synthetase